MKISLVSPGNYISLLSYNNNKHQFGFSTYNNKPDIIEHSTLHSNCNTHKSTQPHVATNIFYRLFCKSAFYFLTVIYELCININTVTRKLQEYIATNVALSKLMIAHNHLSMNHCKLPHHIAFTVNSTQLSQRHINQQISIIAQLIYWSVLSGLHELTLFDDESILHQHASTLAKSLAHIQSNHCCNHHNHNHNKFNTVTLYVIQHGHHPTHTTRFQVTNGTVTACNSNVNTSHTSAFNINILPHISVSNTLYRAAIRLHESSAIESASEYDVIGLMICSAYGSDCALSLPDLLISVTKCKQLNSFPPWLLKNTEVQFSTGLQELNNMNAWNNILRTYSRTEQRYGM